MKTMLTIQLMGVPPDHLQNLKTQRQVILETLVEQMKVAERTVRVVAEEELEGEEETKGEEEDLHITGVRPDHLQNPTTPRQKILKTLVQQMEMAERTVGVVGEDAVVAGEEVQVEEEVEVEETLMVAGGEEVEEGGEGDNRTEHDLAWKNSSTTMLLIYKGPTSTGVVFCENGKPLHCSFRTCTT